MAAIVVIIPGRQHRDFLARLLELRLIGQSVPLSGQLFRGDQPGGLAVGVRVNGISEKQPEVGLLIDDRLPDRLRLPLFGAGAEGDALDCF